MPIVNNDEIRTEIWIDEKGRRRIRLHQDIGHILKVNEEMRKNSKANWNKNKDIKYGANVPALEMHILEQQGITQDKKEFRKWLNKHPEYKTTRKTL